MLPDLIEVSPPRERKESKVVLPGSKSLTNRALILAALAGAPVVLRGALWSEDTQAMVECLERLGFGVEVTDDPAEPANRTLTVQGAGGGIPNAGTPDRPLELFVENAGTAARFLPPMLCLGHGSYRVSGIERMHQRPQAALVQALRQLGYRIDTPNDRLPAVIHGSGPRPGAACKVSVEESSQFASALLLSAGIGGWQVGVTGANEDELPYVDMTRRLVKDFPWNGGAYDIEADASGASYFWGADWFGVKLVLGQVAEEVSAIPSNATLAQRAVYPLAIPTIAGAGSMLTVVLLTDNNVRTIGEQAITTSRLAISLAIVFCVLALSKWIFSVVGRPGIEVMSRVSGLILASIAVHNIIIAAKLSFGLA